MAQRYHLDPQLVRERMKQLDYDQLKLSTEAEVSLRIVTQILGGSECAVQQRTARKLAKALRVDVDEISLGWLTDWQTVPNIGETRHVEILRRAIRFDMGGDHIRAAQECLRVLGHMSSDAEGYPLVVVKYVTFLGNAGQHEEALAWLDKLLAAQEEASLPRRWALYHRGITLRRMSRFCAARADFEELRLDKNPFRASALHQLAAVDLEESKLKQGKEREALMESAEQYLKECLDAWNPFGRTHRKAFAYQRLGQLATLRGQFDLARRHYTEALVLFAWQHCHRYVASVRGDLELVNGYAMRAAAKSS